MTYFEHVVSYMFKDPLREHTPWLGTMALKIQQERSLGFELCRIKLSKSEGEIVWEIYDYYSSTKDWG